MGRKIKFLLLTTVSFFVLQSNAQEGSSKLLDSLAQSLLTIINNSKESSSDYSLRLRFYPANLEKYKSLDWHYINAKDKISVTNGGLLLETDAGKYTLPFMFNVEMGVFEWANVHDRIVQAANSKSQYNVAMCHNPEMYIIFYSNKFTKKDYRNYDKFPKIERLAEHFSNTFNALSIENNKFMYREFAEKFQSKLKKEIAEISDTISEEQRKLIVQANYFNNNKNYVRAIEHYNEAIRINEFSYPAAYYNMALISAELKSYPFAILNMKKYLLLSPDADDARKAQDKIYEWELNIKN